jgi:hypothetical protein
VTTQLDVVYFLSFSHSTTSSHLQCPFVGLSYKTFIELEKWQERRGKKERGGSISILAGRQASRLGGHPDKASAAGKRNDPRKKMSLLLFLSRQFFLLLPLFSTFPSWCQLQIHFAFLPFQSAFLFLSLIVLCFFQPLLVAHRRFFLRRIRRIRRRQLHK